MTIKKTTRKPSGLTIYFSIGSLPSILSPFKITKIVLPSCPITPSGRLMTWKKFDTIRIAITDKEKTMF